MFEYFNLTAFSMAIIVVPDTIRIADEMLSDLRSDDERIHG